MAKRMRVYLAPWLRWAVSLMMVIVWGLISWETFRPGASDALALGEYLFISGFLVVIVVVVWMAGSKGFPVYHLVVEDDEDDADGGSRSRR